VTTRGYITTSALTDYALTSAVPTNNNQLSNGAAYITSSALTGLASETYVTTRGYLTTVAYADITNKPTLFSGSYADLTNKPTIPTDINQLTDVSGLLGQGGGGGGTTYITNNVENPFSFSIAGDDSTLREIANGESIKITGAGGITVTTDAEGAVTVTGTPVSLAGYATESYVTSRGYITGLSWNQLTDKPDLAGTYTFNVAADDSTLRTIGTEETVKFTGAGGITTASDAEGNITITGPSLTGLATETFVTSQGYITGLSYNDLTDKPNLAGTYSWSIAADDSTQVEISTGNLVKIVGTQGVTTTSNSDGQITITGPDLSTYATQSYVTTALSNSGIIVSETAPVGQPEGKLWYNSASLELYVRYDSAWVAASATFSGDYNDLTSRPTIPADVSDLTDTTHLTGGVIPSSATAPSSPTAGQLWYDSESLELYVRYDSAWVATSASFSGDYNDLTNRPTNVSQFANDANYVSRDEVYAMILELGSTNF
jgi:hypothetical protein